MSNNKAMAQVKRDFPKGAVISWRDRNQRRLGTIVGHKMVEGGLASSPTKMPFLKVKSGIVIHALDPDSVFLETI